MSSPKKFETFNNNGGWFPLLQNRQILISELFFVQILSFRTFWTYSTASYGNCFTFNTKLGSSSNNSNSSSWTWSISLPGPNHGLSLVLNLQQATLWNECFWSLKTKVRQMKPQAEYGRMTQDSGVRWVFKTRLDLGDKIFQLFYGLEKWRIRGYKNFLHQEDQESEIELGCLRGHIFQFW